MAWRVLKLQMGKTALRYRWGRRGVAGVFSKAFSEGSMARPKHRKEAVEKMTV
jgi:hypothetical protein